MRISHEIKMKGQYRIEVIRDGKIIQDTGLQDNMILDNFFHLINDKECTTHFGERKKSSTFKAGKNIWIGNGSSPPAVTNTTHGDTWYFNTTSEKQYVYSPGDDHPDHYAQQLIYESNFQYIEIDKIAELGLCDAYIVSTPGPNNKEWDMIMFTRALVKNDRGDSEPLTGILASDTIKVTYELWIYYDARPKTGTFNLATYVSPEDANPKKETYDYLAYLTNISTEYSDSHNFETMKFGGIRAFGVKEDVEGDLTQEPYILGAWDNDILNQVTDDGESFCGSRVGDASRVTNGFKIISSADLSDGNFDKGIRAFKFYPNRYGHCNFLGPEILVFVSKQSDKSGILKTQETTLQFEIEVTYNRN